MRDARSLRRSGKPAKQTSPRPSSCAAARITCPSPWWLLAFAIVFTEGWLWHRRPAQPVAACPRQPVPGEDATLSGGKRLARPGRTGELQWTAHPASSSAAHCGMHVNTVHPHPARARARLVDDFCSFLPRRAHRERFMHYYSHLLSPRRAELGAAFGLLDGGGCNFL